MKIVTMKISLALPCALQKFTIVQENQQGFEWPPNHRYHMSSNLADTNYRTGFKSWALMSIGGILQEDCCWILISSANITVI
jgi:hypothetical protein